MDLQVDELIPTSAEQRGRWQEYTAREPTATFYHSLAWMDAVLAAYGHAAHYLMAYRGSRLVGVFPLFEVHSWLAGAMLVSVPYAVYGGVLADDGPAALVIRE